MKSLYNAYIRRQHYYIVHCSGTAQYTQFHISLFGDGFYLVNGVDTEKPENILAVREPELLPHSPQLSRVLRRHQLTRVSPPPRTMMAECWII